MGSVTFRCCPRSIGCAAFDLDGAIQMNTVTLPRAVRTRTAAIGAIVFGVAVSSALARAEPAPYRLADPVVALVPVIKQHEADLKLDAAQHEQFEQWLKTAPARRKAAEDKLVATRLELRALLLEGGGDAKRQSLIRDIGEQESALVAMRADCMDNMRKLLTPEQFKQAVALEKHAGPSQVFLTPWGGLARSDRSGCALDVASPGQGSATK